VWPRRCPEVGLEKITIELLQARFGAFVRDGDNSVIWIAFRIGDHYWPKPITVVLWG
jgi:hypothetical protein